MASRRDLKKALNNIVFDIVDESYSAQLWTPSKSAASEKVINAADEFQVEMLTKINAAKSKAEFRAIREAIEAKSEELYDAVAGL